jgi:hypothetical protein
VTNGALITTLGKKIILNRAFKTTPDYTAPTVFKVGTGTATPTVADADLQTPITISTTTYKTMVTGYPVLDEANMNATNRAILLTTEATSGTPTITEFGIFNTDATYKCFSRSVFTGISKNNSTQIIFMEKDVMS